MPAPPPARSSRKNLRIAVQAAPLLSLDVNHDSTLLMMRAALKRGYKLFYYDAKDLSWHNDSGGGKLWARGSWVRDWVDNAPWPTMTAPEMVHIGDCDVVLLRQSPPFDLAYLTGTYLLELIGDKVLVVNDPHAVRDAPEKLFLIRYPDLLPPSFISTDADAIDAFRAQHGAIVLKPLFNHSSKEIVRIVPEANGAAIAHYLTHQNKLPCLAQHYVPAVTAGVKRVLLIGGAIIGAYRRIPQAGDFRSGRAAGGTAEACTLTPHDHAMISRFSRALTTQGVLCATADITGDYVTAVNTANPGSFAAIDQLCALKPPDCSAERFWDAVEQKLVLRKL
ncbi:MAG: glutathione synthase [Alphaproteobacteria bacterium]